MTLTRSEQTARVRQRDAKPEMQIRAALWAHGPRYRVNYRTPVCRCDVAFPGKKIAHFVDGCFWHGCQEHYTRPGTRGEF